MARRRPRTEAEFAAINGVGAAKLERFAAPFLAAIAAAGATAARSQDFLYDDDGLPKLPCSLRHRSRRP